MARAFKQRDFRMDLKAIQSMVLVVASPGGVLGVSIFSRIAMCIPYPKESFAGLTCRIYFHFIFADTSKTTTFLQPRIRRLSAIVPIDPFAEGYP